MILVQLTGANKWSFLELKRWLEQGHPGPCLAVLWWWAQYPRQAQSTQGAPACRTGAITAQQKAIISGNSQSLCALEGRSDLSSETWAQTAPFVTDLVQQWTALEPLSVGPRKHLTSPPPGSSPHKAFTWSHGFIKFAKFGHLSQNRLSLLSRFTQTSSSSRFPSC